jgi:hypothetical protein
MGYTAVDAHGDFVVRLSSGTASRPAPTMGGNSIAPDLVPTGTIVLDMFDGSTAQQVWHGTAEAQIDPAQISDPLLASAVQRLLRGFPTRANVATLASPHP